MDDRSLGVDAPVEPDDSHINRRARDDDATRRRDDATTRRARGTMEVASTHRARDGAARNDARGVVDGSRVAEDESFSQRRRGASTTTATAAAVAVAVATTATTARRGAARRESARAFVARRRETFLVQMDVENKTREMARMEARSARREEALRKSERMLEEDQARFDAFLRDNDARVREAVEAAEREARGKHERMKEMRRLRGEVARAERDVRHREDKLSECQKYKEFLDALTPKEWFDARGEDASEMYFKEPEQLLAAFSALEEQNLCLIQNVSDAEETLERVKSEHAREKTRMDAEIADLREQTRRLQEAIEAEEREGKKLTHHLANEREEGEDSVEGELELLTRRVTEVYVECGFDHDPSVSVLQMLTNIEAKMEEYFAAIDKLPPKVVADLEKQKEKERRRLAREQKALEQKREQEIRFQRSLERARAPAYKKTGKIVMFRSRQERKTVAVRSENTDADRELDEFLARQY